MQKRAVVRAPSDLQQYSNSRLYPMDQCDDAKVPPRNLPTLLDAKVSTLKQALDKVSVKRP